MATVGKREFIQVAQEVRYREPVISAIHRRGTVEPDEVREAIRLARRDGVKIPNLNTDRSIAKVLWYLACEYEEEGA